MRFKTQNIHRATTRQQHNHLTKKRARDSNRYAFKDDTPTANKQWLVSRATAMLHRLCEGPFSANRNPIGQGRLRGGGLTRPLSRMLAGERTFPQVIKSMRTSHRQGEKLSFLLT